jgi:putative ABC transport system permease protein
MEFVPVEAVKYGNQHARDTRVFGVSHTYDTVHDMYVTKGRFISVHDVNRGSKVVVLGADVADTLFPFVDPVGKEVTLDGRRFEVVGPSRGSAFPFFNRDNILLVPFGAVEKKDPRLAGWWPTCSRPRLTRTRPRPDPRATGIPKLKYLHKDNFSIFSQDTLTDLYRQITGGIYMVMIAISSIGLLVGGVGVMNIMLVSVTERTREIGVRKALGATRRDILWQFLTEAMTLTGAGGIIGIVIGGLLAFLIYTFSPFPAVLQPTWVMVAFATSMVVGLTSAQARWPRPPARPDRRVIRIPAGPASRPRAAKPVNRNRPRIGHGESLAPVPESGGGFFQEPDRVVHPRTARGARADHLNQGSWCHLTFT